MELADGLNIREVGSLGDGEIDDLLQRVKTDLVEIDTDF